MFNISVSQSSSSLTLGTAWHPQTMPHAIQNKVSSASYDSATWHTDFFKQDPSTTSWKISQTQYICLKAQFLHSDIYEYILIHLINILYLIKRQSIVCNTI